MGYLSIYASHALMARSWTQERPSSPRFPSFKKRGQCLFFIYNKNTAVLEIPWFVESQYFFHPNGSKYWILKFFQKPQYSYKTTKILWLPNAPWSLSNIVACDDHSSGGSRLDPSYPHDFFRSGCSIFADQITKYTKKNKVDTSCENRIYATRMTYY